MIRSMTGYGSVPVEGGRLRGSVTARSVNHRYLDVAMHLTPRLQALDDAHTGSPPQSASLRRCTARPRPSQGAAHRRAARHRANPADTEEKAETR